MSSSSLTPTVLLQRIAATLRRDVGPAVSDEFAKTQAFMAAVVLEKLAGQLASADGEALALQADVVDLLTSLRADLAATPSHTTALLAPALEALAEASDGAAREAALGSLVATLYETRADLGSELFGALLTRVRAVLRRAIDRKLAYAK